MTISLSGLWQHCTSAIRNLPGQHSLVPGHRNVRLFDRKLIITSVKFYLCQNSNSDANPTNFTNAWPVNAIDWAFRAPYVTANETHPPLPPAGVHGSTVCCWHSIYRTYLWLFAGDAFSKCWIFWLFDIMHSQHSHKVAHKIAFTNVSI